MDNDVAWLSLALLGAYHGLNPGMGWLFAVALGLQEGRRGAVVRALGLITLGHAASIAAVVLLFAVAHRWIDLETLRMAAASGLIAFGAYKLLAPLSHPRWVGMRVRGRDLTAWSFMMATAHGAGLMLVPVLLRMPSTAASHAAHAAPASHGAHAQHLAAAPAAATIPTAELLAVAVHTAAMFLVMAAVAILVFDKLGLAVLRRGWINVDRLWAIALVGAGTLTFLL